MFDKIKQRLKEIENIAYKDATVKGDLEKILKSITEVKKEITLLEEKTRALLYQEENKERKEEHVDVTGFLSGIKSARVNVETLLDRGWNYIVSGRYKEAIKELLRAKQMDSGNVRIYNLIGWAYIHLEYYDKASLTFQEVLRLDPDNEMAQANMGYVKYKKGLYKDAIESLSHITENAKNKQALLYALFYLGLVYYDSGMYNDAIDLLNRAIALGPNLFEAYYYLGKVYKKRGLSNMATQIWEKLIKINKYNIWSRKAKEALDGQ